LAGVKEDGGYLLSPRPFQGEGVLLVGDDADNISRYLPLLTPIHYRLKI